MYRRANLMPFTNPWLRMNYEVVRVRLTRVGGWFPPRIVT